MPEQNVIYFHIFHYRQEIYGNVSLNEPISYQALVTEVN